MGKSRRRGTRAKGGFLTQGKRFTEGKRGSREKCGCKKGKGPDGAAHGDCNVARTSGRRFVFEFRRFTVSGKEKADEAEGAGDRCGRNSCEGACNWPENASGV